MIAFVFPGQGAQHVGMGKEIIEQIPVSKEIFDRAARVLDFDLYQLCFEENEDIHKTQFTQPALLSVSYAMMKAVEAVGIKPDAAAGLSLGEYTALTACSALDFEEAVKLVRKRGLFMEEAAALNNGSMAAVLSPEKELIDRILSQTNGIVQIANYNSPSQWVIAGESDALSQTVEALMAENVKVIPLNVSGAFHTSLMQPAADRLRGYLENVHIKPFTVPCYSNYSGEAVSEPHQVKELLINQVTGSVRWEQNIRNMISAGIDQFIEIGPQKTLSGLIKKIDRKVSVYNVSDLISLEGLKDKLGGKV